MYKKWLPQLSKCKLFENMSPDELNSMLKCLDPMVCSYAKNENIASFGEKLKGVGVVLSGRTVVTKESASGDRVIVSMLGPGDMFGEIAAFSGNNIWPATVVSQSDCTAMILPPDKIVSGCRNLCPSHRQLAINMLRIVSDKATMLNRKLDYLTIKSIRGKISAFLIEQSKKTGSPIFMMPLKRSELADFLNVSRPSLSREMCRMRDEGIIEFHRESVRIRNMDALKRMTD